MMLVFRGTMLIGAGVSLLGIFGSRDDRQVKQLIHEESVEPGEEVPEDYPYEEPGEEGKEE